MADILIRDVDPAAVARLKRRAAGAGRSLQAEARLVLEAASRDDRAAVARRAEALRRGLSGRAHSDSVALLRADRRR
jgi:plasmid stability protein